MTPAAGPPQLGPLYVVRWTNHAGHEMSARYYRSAEAARRMAEQQKARGRVDVRIYRTDVTRWQEDRP